MSRPHGSSLILKAVLLALIACTWMSMGVLSDCNPTVANTFLEGVEGAAASLADGLISAAFSALMVEEKKPAPVNTGS